MSLGAIQNKSSAAEAVSYDNSTTSAMISSTNVQGAIDQLFQSVSNGKSLIASAITDKGVSTSASDNWETMAGNIVKLGNKNIYINNNILIETSIDQTPWYTPVLNFQPQNIILCSHGNTELYSIVCYISEKPILFCMFYGMEIRSAGDYANEITVIKENNQIGLLSNYSNGRRIYGNYFLMCYD